MSNGAFNIEAKNTLLHIFNPGSIHDPKEGKKKRDPKKDSMA